ncbi:MAG: DNA ligase, partial [Microgenomates group bacterium]
MKFKELSLYLEKLEKTSSRIEITKILADLFKQSSSDEIDKIVYLLAGNLAPSYKGIVFNLAEKMMIRVIAKAYGQDEGKVNSEYKKVGDLGLVAESLSKGQKNNDKGFSVLAVYEEMYKMAKDSGEGSQERKVNQTANLLKDLDPLSCRFVSRIPTGKLRLGFSDKTVLDALSWMV